MKYLLRKEIAMKHHKNKKIFHAAVLVMTVLLCGMLQKSTAAAFGSAQPGAFNIEAKLLHHTGENCDIRLTVENQGEDWEGTVRLTVENGYGRRPCAYDTSLSLPQGSVKQFVVRIGPVISYSSYEGTVNVSLLDRKDRTVAAEEFDGLLADREKSLSLGILSDDYPDLTYLDMGTLYFYDDQYPVSLVELKQEDLLDSLDALTFLVIDRYNTGILTADEFNAIEQWNRDGGVLIVGTGAYAQDTLRGFGGGYSDLPGISCTRIDAPIGDMSENDTAGNDTLENDTPGNDTTGYDTPSAAGNVYADYSQVSMAQLQGFDASFDEDYTSQAMNRDLGDGSICILPYSLAELGRLDSEYWTMDRGMFAYHLLDNASVYARSRFASRYDAAVNYYSDIRDMLDALGNSNSILSFGLLKVIVVLYVIFAGPLLYLILRLAKRRELYWLAVPVTSLLTVLLIFLAGRGFEIVNTRVFSVTVQDLAGGGQNKAYLYCYDADRREWELKLAEGFESAGPFDDAPYNYRVDGDEDSYFYHITKEGDTFYVGLRPDSSFEDSYFCLSGIGDGQGAEGGLVLQDVSSDWAGLMGTLSNETGRDLSCFAVLYDDAMFIYGGLPAGETEELKNREPLYYVMQDSSSPYMYRSFLEDLHSVREYGKASDLAALGTGIYSIMPQLDGDEAVVIGVTRDWEKTVDDNCNEISYGCLYSVQ